jgi:hypothetical protein
MKRVLPTAVHLALALWIGAVACVAALVAPSAFRHLETGEAGRMLSPVFRGVDYLGVATSIGLLFCLSGWRRKLAAVMGACAAASAFYLAPRVEGRNAYHYAAEGAWTVILIGGLVLLWGAHQARRPVPPAG